MKHLAPSSFSRFACAAGACPDCCCRAGWEIVPDEQTMRRYQALPGDEGERIRAGIVPGEAPLLRQDAARVCVLLDPDGLCCVQRHFGHEALCRVCRDYPRFCRVFGALTEHGISLSCPSAYALAVSEPPAWTQWEDSDPPALNEIDPETYLHLRRGRDLALSLLARESLPFPRRLYLLRRLTMALERAPARGRLRRDYALRLRRWERLSARRHDWQAPELNPGAAARRFLKLELLSPAWEDALRRFAALSERGQRWRDPTAAEQELCARYLWHALFKYWMDALDDGALLARVDRSILMSLLGAELDRALPEEGPFLQRLSREIEHCEENLSALLRYCAQAAPLDRGAGKAHPARLRRAQHPALRLLSAQKRKTQTTENT